jgi:hypothetical protein
MDLAYVTPDGAANLGPLLGRATADGTQSRGGENEDAAAAESEQIWSDVLANVQQTQG